MGLRISFAGSAATLSVAVALSLAGCRSAAPPAAAAPLPVVPIVRASRADLVRTLELASEFRPFQEIGVFAKEAGYVRHIYVDVGDRVHAGDLLAELEIPELNDQLNQDVASTAAAQSDVTQAQQVLTRDQDAAKVARELADRMDQVIARQPDLLARQEVDTADGNAAQAEAQVAAAQSALAAAQDRVEASKQAQQQAHTLLDYGRIVAPFTGVVTARYADNGAMLQAGIASHTQAMPLVQLSQNDRLRLVIPVPEADVAFIHLHDPVQVRVPALNRVFAGSVARFADMLDLDTRTLHTEVDVPNPSYTLMPGMYAYADLTLERATQVVALPVEAVNQAGGQATVQIVNPQNQVEIRNVSIGLQTPTLVEIRSGVAPGEPVVAGNGGGLRNGEKVQPQLLHDGGH